MSVKRKNLFLWFSVLVIFAGALIFILFNENGILKFIKLRGEINKLDDDIKKAELKLNKLLEEIDSLNTDKAKIERVSRERYHMMLPNENVIRIQVK
jgi:cell division protein FtsB